MNRLESLPYLQPVAPRIYLAAGPANGRFPHCNGFLLLGDRAVPIEFVRSMAGGASTP
ncbi:hypothetical protein [Desulfosarcina alkanivorans]|jgi:hypothetical protein|uniref:hypothetical protein n=1 Tax=Desulfosarcina alkanivorans TaxID=571177 RepID=UPI0012D356E3|nr:hypothetical protein [Desulfosarcina alkanivorans]